jgi:hypothetical protein
MCLNEDIMKHEAFSNKIDFIFAPQSISSYEKGTYFFVHRKALPAL